MCAGGEDSLSSTPADTHSPSHGRGPVGADSETDNSHTEKRNSATGGDTGTAQSPLPRYMLIICSLSLLQLHHHLKADILEEKSTLQTLQQHNLDLTMVSIHVKIKTICCCTPTHSLTHSLTEIVYSGTSNNGHSEERTTSLQRTKCMPPADNRMHSIHFYLRDTDTSNLRITDKPHVPNGCPVYKITSDNGQQTRRKRESLVYTNGFPNLEAQR